MNNFDKDRSQDQSNTNSDNIDTQKIRSNQNYNDKNDREHDNEDKVANNANHDKICKLIEKIKMFVKHKNDHNERTRTRIQSL